LQLYSPIVNIETEVQRLSNVQIMLLQEIQKLENTLVDLRNEVGVLQFERDLQEAGWYKPRYNFDTSSEIKNKIESTRGLQKVLIKDGQAIFAKVEWTIGGSKSEGKKLIQRIIKMGLAAFNVQADNVILTASILNGERSEEKLAKIRDNVNKLLEPSHCEIKEEFYRLKVEELHLALEYQEKLRLEKEEQRRIKLMMQEEEKVRKELERIQKEAEQEEKAFESALKKARIEIETASETEKAEMMDKIKALEADLEAAHSKKDRALSQAQLTKSGHVYVVSNIGSFGDDVYKIGMTRRLDPIDRIKELSDASVPFDFDVHAMIYSKDAPHLENVLHDRFNSKRVNRVNVRKEFFNVNIGEIAQACHELGVPVSFTMLAEAAEFKASNYVEKKAA
jgi:hypothetical protein